VETVGPQLYNYTAAFVCKNCLQVWQRYDRWPGERRSPPDEEISVEQAVKEGILDVIEAGILAYRQAGWQKKQ
jgi:hypothetical protein